MSVHGSNTLRQPLYGIGLFVQAHHRFACHKVSGEVSSTIKVCFGLCITLLLGVYIVVYIQNAFVSVGFVLLQLWLMTLTHGSCACVMTVRTM